MDLIAIVLISHDCLIPTVVTALIISCLYIYNMVHCSSHLSALYSPGVLYSMVKMKYDLNVILWYQ